MGDGDDKASRITAARRSDLESARDRIRAEYLFSREHRPATTGVGIHHTALICADVATTVEWYPSDVHSTTSIYTQDPDGARIEFIQDPLGEMYGHPTT